MEMRKGMPGLKKAGKLTNERLEKYFRKYRYAPCACTPALWAHVTLPITFTIVLDDFGVKYTGKRTALHLLNALEDLYTVSVNYTGTLYFGLNINWYYHAGHVDISMPDYISQALHPKTRRRTSQMESPQIWRQTEIRRLR